MSLTPQHEEKTGADLSGIDGGTSRTYALANADAILAQFRIIVDGVILQSTIDFTLDTGTDTLTFVKPTFDDQNITLDYWTGTGTLLSGSYCTVTDVSDILMLGYAFSSTTKPTATAVSTWIVGVEDEIDQATQHSWKETTKTDEFYNIEYRERWFWGAGVKINVENREVRSMDTDEGDKIEIWDGTQYVDWVATKTEGRNEDYWWDYNQGILFINKRHWSIFQKPIRLTYRFGVSNVPGDIRKAASQLVAIMILTNEDNSFTLNETGDNRNMPYDPRISVMRANAKRILANRTEFGTF